MLPMLLKWKRKILARAIFMHADYKQSFKNAKVLTGWFTFYFDSCVHISGHPKYVWVPTTLDLFGYVPLAIGNTMCDVDTIKNGQTALVVGVRFDEIYDDNYKEHSHKNAEKECGASSLGFTNFRRKDGVMYCQ